MSAKFAGHLPAGELHGDLPLHQLGTGRKEQHGFGTDFELVFDTILIGDKFARAPIQVNHSRFIAQAAAFLSGDIVPDQDNGFAVSNEDRIPASPRQDEFAVVVGLLK
jgi:hypothetical protein